LGCRRAQGDDERVEAFDAVGVEREPGLTCGQRTIRRRDLLAADRSADHAPERSDTIGLDVEPWTQALGLSPILGESLLALESARPLDPGIDLVVVERASWPATA
jgi:hypothetical protein